MKETKKTYSEWKPEFSAEALEHLSALRSTMEPRIELMRRFRRELGLTQVEVAELLGMTQANVSKVERRGDPSLSFLARMAEARGKRLRIAIESEAGNEEASFELC